MGLETGCKAAIYLFRVNFIVSVMFSELIPLDKIIILIQHLLHYILRDRVECFMHTRPGGYLGYRYRCIF